MRQKKNGSPKFVRLESIEVIELSDRHRISELCPDGYVYDLEIEDNHNYLADGILVHNCSAFPKPNKTYKIVKNRFGHLPMIFLSGTPATESASQWYHSFALSKRFNPFAQYKNFYRWFDVFGIPKIRYFGTIKVNDYSNADLQKIMPIINKYIITFTQKEAGFISEIKENILYIEYSQLQEKLIKQLKRDKIIQGNNDVIIADSGAKLMSKIHQISNGTIILDSGNSIILETKKAEFIKSFFEFKKIAIFYYYQKELDLLKQVFGESLTTDLNEFNETKKNIALQQITGSEGISLKKADCLVYYSFGFSGKNYIQGRDRMTTIDRLQNNVFFVFPSGSIDEKIYNVIKEKKTYTEKLFRGDFRI